MKTVRLALFLCAALFSQACLAQGPFTGAWDVVRADNAPWLVARPELKPFPEPKLKKARFVFSARRVTAPGWMGCRAAQYEMLSLPFAALFEGGLSDPAKGLNDPAALAHQLGYASEPVVSMLTGCSELLYHLVDPDTAQFALNNMIYTLHRTKDP